MKKPKFLQGGFSINRKINATIVFYYKSTPLFSTISHFELLSENNGHPIVQLLRFISAGNMSDMEIAQIITSESVDY